ncbi:putative aminotransferase [bacterium HR40]|nr:putative aminotransferase [bacterium HR40]
MSRVLHRDLHRELPVVVGGEGCWLFDRDGRRYLDACGGAAVSCLGHRHPEVHEAIARQLDRIAWAHTSFFTSEPAEELAAFLVDRAPGDFGRVLFVSGGSEAVEAALKLARQYFVEIHEPQRRHILARRQSYHGNTLGALAVGGNPGRRRTYEPLLVAAQHLTPCYPYREQRPGESDAAFLDRLVAELEEHLARLGPETVIAFVAEPVVGATLGAVPAVPGYFRRIREVLDRHGILLILDEVMCGMGRTGTLWAFKQEGVVPDLVAIAKGLGGGFQPIGAVLVRERIVRAIEEGSGALHHGHTYMGHPTACAAALAVQRIVERDGLLDRVKERGQMLDTLLRARFGHHPQVGDIRGRGLLQAIELVRDRASREPFDPAARLHARIKAEAMRRGLLCYPLGGTVDGCRGDHVLLAPPYIVSPEELELLVDRLGEAVDAAVAAIS